MSEEFRKEMLKRIEQMGLTEKDILIRERNLHKFYKSKLDHDKLMVDIEKDLGLIQCRKNKNIVKINNPIIIKVDLYTVFKFYINLGHVFRDNNRKVYSLEEVEQLLIDYYEKHNIDYKLIWF